MGKRNLNRTLDKVPGPGHYEPINHKVVHSRSPSATIHPPRVSPRPRYAPGPGHYDPDHSFVKQASPKYKIGGSTERLHPAPRDSREVPGPGHYEKKQLIGGDDSVKYTIGSRPHIHTDPHHPGPGHYEPSHTLVHSKSPPKSFSKLERGDPIPREKRNAPGPGEYDYNDQRFAKISYKFSELERPDCVPRDQKVNPGPGHYERPTIIGG